MRATAAKHNLGRVAIALAALAALPLAVADDIRGGSDPFDQQPDFLPVQQAFVLSARLEVAAQPRLVARWTMPPGYYLYRRKFAIKADADDALGALSVADGEPKVDDFFGEVEVYYEDVEVSAPVHVDEGVLEARISYQGCADYGLCYPLQTRTVAFDAATGAALVHNSPVRVLRTTSLGQAARPSRPQSEPAR